MTALPLLRNCVPQPASRKVSSDENSTTGRINRIWLAVEKLLSLIAVTLLFSMMGLTCADVVARYLFNQPIKGAFELTEILLACLIFCALPLTTKAGEHIEVEFLSSLKSMLVNNLLNRFSALVVFAVFGIFAIELWKHAAKLAERGTMTNSLELPLSVVGYVAFVSCAVCAIIMLCRLLKKGEVQAND